MIVTTSLLIVVFGAALLLAPILLILFMSAGDDGDRNRREALPSAYSPEANRPGPTSLPASCIECGAENYPWRDFCWRCGREFERSESDRTESLRRAFGTDKS